MFWVISVYFNIRNTLPESGTFLLGHPVYTVPISIFFGKHAKHYGHVARTWERRDAYRILLAKPEGKGPLERPRRRKEYNIRMDLQEMGGGWHGLDRSGSAPGAGGGNL